MTSKSPGTGSIFDLAREKDELYQDLRWAMKNLPVLPSYGIVQQLWTLVGKWVRVKIQQPDLLPEELLQEIVNSMPKWMHFARNQLAPYAKWLPNFVKHPLMLGEPTWLYALHGAGNTYHPMRIGELTSLIPMMLKLLKVFIVLGPGMGGSQAMNGTSSLHVETAERIAKFLGCESGVIFSTGVDANRAIIEKLVEKTFAYLESIGKGRKIRIFYDKKTHNSLMRPIITDTKMDMVLARPIDVNDFAKFQHRIDKAIERNQKPDLIVLMGVTSTTGQTPALKEILAYCYQLDIQVLLDDAHGIGVLGANGKGTLEYLGVPKEHWPRYITGTFSKAFHSVGGFFVGSREDCIWVLTADAKLFTAAQSAFSLVAILHQMDYMEKRPDKFQLISQNNTDLKQKLENLGVEMADSDKGSSVMGLIIRRRKEETKEEFYKRAYEAWLVLLSVGRVYTNLFVGRGVGTDKYVLLRLSLPSTFGKKEFSHLLKVLPIWAERYQVVSEENAA